MAATRSLNSERSAVLDFYRRQSAIYDATRWLTLHGRESAVRALALRPGESVLAAGCGTGLELPLLRAQIGASGSLTGVDLSPHMLHVARRRVARAGWTNVRLIEQDICMLELGSRFDVVVFFYCLSMTERWPAALERAAVHLKRGGRLLVLDFGALRAPRLLAGLYERWLRANLTDPGRPYAPALRRWFAEVTEIPLLRGYARVVLATSPKGL